MSRLETGPYKRDEDDWMGYFLRGDDAYNLAMTIESYLKGAGGPMGKTIYEAKLRRWASHLKECIEDEEGD